MRRSYSFFALMLAVFTAMPGGIAHAAQQLSNMQIYSGTLQSGWTNKSTCPVDFNSTDYLNTSPTSIKVTYATNGQKFYLSCNGLSTIGYANLSFWINGGATNGRKLVVGGYAGGGGQGFLDVNKYITGNSVAANSWRQVTVPLSLIGLGNTASMTGIFIQNSGAVQAPFYIDNISIITPPPPPQKVSVNFNLNQHAINPQIYGVAYATQAQLADLNSPLNRWGGNATSRYNWLTNATNHASDWFFESIANASSTASADADSFISTTQAANAQAMMTIPTLGWVAKIGANRATTGSFSQAKYGSQTASDGDAGNGVLTNGQNVVNDPTDANQTADSAFAQSWVQHFTSTFGLSSKGGLTYYCLDNEPSIWHATHRDVHPIGAKMSEIASKTEDYAAKIKAADPGAQIVGPEEWGWSGYFYSGYDQQYGSQHGWNNLPDRAANNNQDYLPWLLSTLHAYDVANKTKSLDVFSVHYYPQGGEFGNDTTTSMQLLRNRSTRSLWDPNYVDTSWIGTQVQLIPRMKGWVASNYAGLKTGITEYNWGAEGSINGATTQADIFGIFGREGLDMGTRWTTPDASTPTYKAMKMYRNVDGNNNGFGDLSVSDVVSDADTLSSFAAVRSSDGQQTVMVINKALSGPTSATVTLSNLSVGGPMQTWQLTTSNVITRLADTNLSGNTSGVLTLSLPAQSVTLYVIPAKIPIPVAPTSLTATAGDAQVTLNWTASVGATGYNVKRSLTKGGPYTNIGTSPTPLYLDTAVTNGTTYYYVVSAVNVSGESPNSNEANATPLAPILLTATAGNAQVSLNWVSSIAASTYNVKRSTVKGGPYTKIGTSSTLSYTDTSVTNGTTYYYVVSANGASGESVNSNEAAANPAAPTVPSSITNLFNTGVDNNNNPSADGISDIHYSIVKTPTGQSAPAYVTLTLYPFAPGVWVENSPTSKWISPEANESQQNDPIGNYTYQTTFTVTGDPTKVSISGRVLGDNRVTTILLNGQPIVTNLSSNFITWSNFAINSGFVSGTNTLQFIVTNDYIYLGPYNHNPTGFRCEMTPASK